MTEDEKTAKMNEYTQVCAKIGDLETTKEFIEFDLMELKAEARQILKEFRNVQKQELRDVQKPV